MFLFLDLKKMILDIRSKNKWLGLWGQALNFPMFLAPLFFYDKTSVWIIFICNLIAVLIAAQIHKKTPFSRMTSICHLVWLPMIFTIIQEVGSHTSATSYQFWLYYVVTTVCISIVFDIFNLVKHASGDRSEIG